MNETLREARLRELALEERKLKLEEDRLKFEREKWQREQELQGQRQKQQQYQVQEDRNTAQLHGAHQYVSSRQDVTGVVPSVHFFAADDTEPNCDVASSDRVLDPSEM